MTSRRIFKWCLVGAALIIGGVALYMPTLSTVMLFWFAASRAGGLLLGVAAALMLVAALTWPIGAADDEAPIASQALRFPGGPRAP